MAEQTTGRGPLGYRIIGALKLGIAADRIRITPVEEVFAR